jgi:hypothetical protein
MCQSTRRTYAVVVGSRRRGWWWIITAGHEFRPGWRRHEAKMPRGPCPCWSCCPRTRSLLVCRSIERTMYPNFSCGGDRSRNQTRRHKQRRKGRFARHEMRYKNVMPCLVAATHALKHGCVVKIAATSPPEKEREKDVLGPLCRPDLYSGADRPYTLCHAASPL